MKIYVNWEVPKTLPSFLRKFFMSDRKTFANKECTILQCAANKFRSFDDLYNICKTYYPKTTLNILMRYLLLYENKRNNLYRYMQLGSCHTMKKTRVYTSLWIPSHYNKFNGYSYLININKYKSKYSWKELLSMININNQKELNDFMSKKK